MPYLKGIGVRSDFDDGADDVAGLHGMEGVFDLVEGDDVGDHSVELELAVQVELSQEREVV